MVKVLIDTSIIIDFTRQGKGAFVELMELAENDNAILYVSCITLYEFWSGLSMKEAQLVKDTEVFFSQLETITIDTEIAKNAGSLNKEKIVTSFDAIIAATALENDLQLATLNIKHFKNVPGLKLWQSKSALG